MSTKRPEPQVIQTFDLGQALQQQAEARRAWNREYEQASEMEQLHMIALIMDQEFDTEKLLAEAGMEVGKNGLIRL